MERQGLLGQDLLYIKSGDLIWSLRVVENILSGRISLDNGESWSQWRVLVEEYNGFFSFTIGGDNSLHIICKGKPGIIQYICWLEENIHSDQLGEAWVGNEKIIYQSILVNSDGIPSIIYFTENPLEEIWEIKYCRWDDGEWGLPQVVDKGLGSGQNQGACAIEPNGTIHLLYQIFHNQKYQFVHRELALGASWTNRAIITDATRNNLFPCMVIDQQGTLHLTWIRSDGINYRVMYRKKSKGGWMVGGWQQEQFLSPSGVNAYNPIIGITQEEVIMLWQQLEGIYKSVSLDRGKSFRSPVLEEKFERLSYKNLLSFDNYRHQGVTTMETFNTGSTAIALLATIYQEQREGEPHWDNLPEIKETNALSLSKMDYLTLDYGQRGLKDQLQQIDGNVQKLLFETEDVRLTNMQMQETITEQRNMMTGFEEKADQQAAEIKLLRDKLNKKQNINDSLQSAMTNSNKEKAVLDKEKHKLQKKLDQAEERLTKSKAEYGEIVKDSQAMKEEVASLQDQLRAKDKQIIANEQEAKSTKKQLVTLQEAYETLERKPLWRKLF